MTRAVFVRSWACPEHTSDGPSGGRTKAPRSCTILLDPRDFATPASVEQRASCMFLLVLEDAARLIGRHARPDETTDIDGVLLSAADGPREPQASTTGTVMALIAQGSKRLAIGDRVYDYGAGQYLVASRRPADHRPLHAGEPGRARARLRARPAPGGDRLAAARGAAGTPPPGLGVRGRPARAARRRRADAAPARPSGRPARCSRR